MNTHCNRSLLSWPITNVPLLRILDITGIKFENKRVKMVVNEYMCCSRTMEVRPSVVSLQQLFFCIPVD